MIEIKNITKKFKNNLVLDNISFTVNEGEAVGILGSNGAGKTTLMEIMVGQIKATSGEVLIDGQTDGYKKTGIQFQDGMWPKGTSSDILIKYFKKKWFSDFDDWTKELIKIFEIEQFLKKDLNDLSGGQRQRLNTLLSVINDPNYIFLDEMITGLDLKMQLTLMDFFIQLKAKGKTLVIISHIPEEIEQICDRIIILDKGKIYYQNTIQNILKEFKSVRKLLKDYYKGDLKSNEK